MKRPRKPYPDEFKQEAVRLLTEQRLPRSHIARDLGVDPEMLRRWLRELALDVGVSLNIAPAPSVNAAELIQLRGENERHAQKPSASSRGCRNEPERAVRGHPGE